MKRLICAGIALVLATVGIAACGGGEKGQAVSSTGTGEAGSSKQYAELRWATEPFPGALNTYTDGFGQVLQVSSLALQGLVEFEPNGSIKPSLASSVENPNPTTYVYHLKPGVRFSSGKPVTVEDVVFSLERNMVKTSVTEGYWADVSSVTSSGSSTVVVKLKRPNPFWESILAYSGQIIEKVEAERVGEKALGTPGNLPIGTGPWKFDSFTPNVSVILSRNPYWDGTPPPAAKITIDLFKEESQIALALRSGAIDGTFQILSTRPFAHIAGTRLLTAPGANEMYLAMNTQRSPFNDVHVRRAIAYAADVQGMVKTLFPGTGSEDATVTPPSTLVDLGTPSQVSALLGSLPHYPFNLTDARRELSKSAYPHGFTTSVIAVAGEESPDIAAQILSRDLAKIGINARVEEITPTAVSGLSDNKMTIVVGELVASYADPEALMSCVLPPSQISTVSEGCNLASFNNARVNKLQAQEGQTTDSAKRLRLIRELLQIVGTEAPYKSLYTHDMYAQLSDKYVFPGFSNWTAYSRPWALDVRLAK